MLAALSFGIAATGLMQSASAQSVAEIALTQGANRSQTLIEGAKKEGQLNVYAVLPSVALIAAAFTKKYGIKVNIWRASSENILQRVMTEARAGRADLDFVQNNGPEMEPLHREKLLQQVNSPYLADLIPEAIPAHKEWVAATLDMFVQGYNTNSVKKEDLPKTYQGLLDPKWKGKIGIEIGDQTWFAYVLQDIGKEKGIKLFKDIIATNGISVHKGHSLLGQLVSSGEVPLALTLYGYNPDQLKDKGAPIARFNISTPIFNFQAMAVMKKAPHPYSAVLFYDFMISEEGQEIFSRLHNIVTSTKFDVAQKKIPMKFIDPADALDENDKNQQIYDDIFMKRSK